MKNGKNIGSHRGTEALRSTGEVGFREQRRTLQGTTRNPAEQIEFRQTLQQNAREMGVIRSHWRAAREMKRILAQMAISVFLLLAFAGLFVRAAQPQESAPKPVDIAEAEVVEHRIGTRGPIYVSGRMYYLSNPPGFPPVVLELVIGSSGKVVSAKGVGRFEYFEEKLFAAARTWEYKPFQVAGRPVVARIRETIDVLPFEQRAATQIPFPEIRDWNSLRITLTRTPCYGMCPSYTVEIHGDGTVLYEGKSGVGVKGPQRGAISKAAVQELVEIFRKADYFSLADGYISFTTDNPTQTTSISFDDKAKWIVNYIGSDVGMPRIVSELEIAIDRLSGASKWVKKQP